MMPGELVYRTMSATWSALSAGARAAADRGWLHSTRLPVRVVSVGNIQAGGAGKTPLVACIAREAAERRLKVLILCRGYGGRWEHAEGGGVLRPGVSKTLAADCGDEALVLGGLAPEAVVGVGADRARQYERAVAETVTPDLVILDDGFQHWKIKKDLEIVAVTSRSRGRALFRDSDASLRRADLIVWTKGEKPPTVPEGKPFVRVRYRLARPAESVASIPVWLITGVADSSSVVAVARAAGYRVDQHVCFPDHARYALNHVQEILAGAARSGVRIALTGKDWVKWRELPGIGALRDKTVTVLEPELEWLEGREQWDRVLWGS